MKAKKREPKLDPSPMDLAWAAGFLDGEGCFQIGRYFDKRKGYQRYMARVGATQKRREPLDFLQRMFGGTIVGRFNKNWNTTYWFWYLATQQAVSAAEKLIPYLRLKRAEAETLIEFRAIMARRYRNRWCPYNDGERALYQALYERCSALKGTNKGRRKITETAGS